MFKKLWITFFVVSSLLQAAPTILFVEGNMGVGKSTFLNLFGKLDLFETMSEPCDLWQDVKGLNLFEAFYKDPASWACLFQLYVVATRIKKLEDCIVEPHKVLLVDRSWFCDRYCFAQNAFETGLMSQLEWNVYCNLWDIDVAKAPQPFGIIYLRADAQVCFDRVKQRSLSEESGVTLEYMQQLHNRHENWLLNKQNVDAAMDEIPVLVLDCNQDFEHDIVQQQKFMQQILDFLNIRENIDLTMRKDIV